MHVLIIGAGPVGLEAALHAVKAGYEVTVVEAGASAGYAIRRWGHVPLFSPWSMNVSATARALLAERGVELPNDDTCPSGEVFVEAFLEPLAAALDEEVEFRFGADATAIGRGRLLKGEHIGDGGRVGVPFRVLLEGADADEYVEADVVIDCSGTLRQPNFLGIGGVPALGEAENDEWIERYIPDLDFADREDFVGQRVLLVGSGMSAATTLDGLLMLHGEDSATRVVWVPTSATPYTPVENDPLPERARLAELGNAALTHTAVTSYPGAGVVALREVEGGIEVTLETADGDEAVEVVDRIVSNTGYRPDTDLFGELQVHLCYASQGTMKLAASLLGEAGGDCLAQPTPVPELLQNPEPGFFVLGSKSYGRNSNFLLRVGYEQVEAVFGLLGAE